MNSHTPDKTGKTRLAPSRWLFPVTGAIAALWFAFRVFPKPSRVAYPCQRMAAPVAATFVVWLAGVLPPLAAVRGAAPAVRRGFAVLAVAGLLLLAQSLRTRVWFERPNAPIGVARGIHPGRVVWAHHPGVVSWDGHTGYWWEARYTDDAALAGMVSRSLRSLTGAGGDAEAWDALFRHHNSAGGGTAGYQPGEKIAIKVNVNPSKSYNWIPYENRRQRANATNVSPALLTALIDQLVNRAGVAESDITVYDAARIMGWPMVHFCRERFPGVQFLDRKGMFGRTKAVPDLSIPVYFASDSVPDNGRTYLPTAVTQARYLINVAIPKGHLTAGVSLCGKNHFGSIWRPSETIMDGWLPRSLHPFIAVTRPMGSFNPIVDLMGHEQLGGKTVLYMLDGLYSAMGSSGYPTRWQSAPFNGRWPASLFLSQDPVAIDSVAFDFLANEPMAQAFVRGSAQNYLHEAALAGAPPSKSVYDPEHDGTRLGSLGVHEHWNGPAHRQYSRNLGTGAGIELVAASE